MTTRDTRYESQEEGRKSERGDPGTDPGSAKSGHRVLLYGDPLGRLISLNPIFVALTFIGLGWGTLLLIAWRLEVIESQFLSSPAFMVGDLALLPLCGALMAVYYRSASLEMPSEWGLRISIGSAVIAGVAAGATAAFSILASETYAGVWSIPHTLFIWFFGYTFISFLLRAFSDMVFYLSARKVYHVTAVTLLPVAHVTIKASLGGSLG